MQNGFYTACTVAILFVIASGCLQNGKISKSLACKFKFKLKIEKKKKKKKIENRLFQQYISPSTTNRQELETT